MTYKDKGIRYNRNGMPFSSLMSAFVVLLEEMGLRDKAVAGRITFLMAGTSLFYWAWLKEWHALNVPTLNAQQNTYSCSEGVLCNKKKFK